MTHHFVRFVEWIRLELCILFVANGNSTNCFKFWPKIIVTKIDYFGKTRKYMPTGTFKNNQFLDITEKNAVKAPRLLKYLDIHDCKHNI